ncbi:type II toxin-antitoxin system HipA family toxin [Defluviimonas salinarum]|uniref:HipA domain-containing protein n=1 Tax=Defluviimonas salinarum TaxID=2992147 RepID=A0ABT3J7F0_9RHOB|nr:HipA domain-containing protein [Defluviimonas salinarum]MCW3783570.1 HipA domain-containing protein [Defluviimonas salinarum]
MQHRAVVFIDLDGVSVPAGKIRILEDGRYSMSEFAYGRKYLERPDAVALDPVQLPLGFEVMRTPDDFPIFNGIRDAAPDAWGRKLIDRHMIRALGRPAGEAEYLLTSQSGNRIGGLRFGPDASGPGPIEGVPPVDGFIHLGDLGDFRKAVDAIERFERLPVDLADFIAPGSDLGGARPKATVMVDGFPWLVKFGLERDRIDMARIEAACLDLCEMAGIETCRRDVIEIAGRSALLLSRFDRVEAEGDIRRRHMISSLTLLGAHEADRGASGYADLYDGMRRHGVAGDHGEAIFRRMVMNVLCGNTDDHYRNHAFLLEPGGRYSLSPAYDVTPTLQAGTTRHLFLHLGKPGSGREATLENAISGGPSLGLRLEEAAAIANEMSAVVGASWRQVMRDRGVGLADLEMVENSFRQAGRQVEPDDARLELR